MKARQDHEFVTKSRTKRGLNKGWQLIWDNRHSYFVAEQKDAERFQPSLSRLSG